MSRVMGSVPVIMRTRGLGGVAGRRHMVAGGSQSQPARNRISSILFAVMLFALVAVTVGVLAHSLPKLTVSDSELNSSNDSNGAHDNSKISEPPGKSATTLVVGADSTTSTTTAKQPQIATETTTTSSAKMTATTTAKSTHNNVYFGGQDPPKQAQFLPQITADGTATGANVQPVVLAAEVVATYPHDPNAFTQGLLYDEETDTLLESTGMYGDSELREVDVKTGQVLRRRKLHRRHFGEGLDLYRKNNVLTQLLWRTGEAIRYDRATFKELRGDQDLTSNTPAAATIRDATSANQEVVGGEFFTPMSDGWGIASDGGDVVYATDSSTTLYELDAKSLKMRSKRAIQDAGRAVPWLNEIEVVNGLLFGQIWQTECMAIVEPTDARVVGWVHFNGLTQQAANLVRTGKLQGGRHRQDVFNGVAYDSKRKRLFVTGKYWPALFEVRLVERQPSAQDLENVRRACIVRGGSF